MNKIIITENFMKWLFMLKDVRARTLILTRIDRAKKSNFGDHKQLTEDLFEMRLTHGAGYRIYYTKKEMYLYIILVGGDKSSQSKDIEKAKIIMTHLD